MHALHWLSWRMHSATQSLHHPYLLTRLLHPPLQSVQKDEEAARQEGMAAMSETFRHKGAEIYLEDA